MSPIIEVKNLHKIYTRNNKKAVDDISFTIDQGQCFGLLGPNGAGKSTTLEILQGLKKPSNGSVSLFGESWEHNESALRTRIGGLLQENNLYEKLKVEEAIILFASFYKHYTPIDEILENFNLTPQRNVWLSELSGGQRQRVFLAMAIVGQPELVFLDEPTTGLDPTSRQEFWEILQHLKQGGTTIVLTTHYMDEAEYLCDNLAIIDHGKIIETGAPKDIINRTFKEPISEEPRTATLNDVFLKLTGYSITRTSSYA